MILKFHLQSMFAYRDTKLGEMIFIGLRYLFFHINAIINFYPRDLSNLKKQSGIEININCHFWLPLNGKVDRQSTFQDWLENKNGTYTDPSYLQGTTSTLCMKWFKAKASIMEVNLKNSCHYWVSLKFHHWSEKASRP